MKLLILALLIPAIFAKPEKPIKEVCYDGLGCFNNAYPYTNAEGEVPEDPAKINVEFLLFTPDNRVTGEPITYKDINTIQNSKFNPNLPLKVIIHGFSNDINIEWMADMRLAFLDHNVNVIVTGWGNGAKFPDYAQATANTRIVAKEASLLLKSIFDTFYVNDPQKFNVHCTGHSLGAHTCGMVGSTVSNDYKIVLNRITALDPAGPFYEDGDSKQHFLVDPIVRVDVTDARYVDAYHTNAGSLIKAAFGMRSPVGHVDFYVNGGSMQPGCPGAMGVIQSVLGGKANPNEEIGCSHGRSHQYFIESIKSTCSFLAFKCADEDSFYNGQCLSCDNQQCTVMGFYADNYKGRGSFYLLTQAEKPYCGLQHYLELTIPANSPKTNGKLNLQWTSTTDGSVFSTTIDGLDIEPGKVIRRMFIVSKDLIDSKNLDLSYAKKKGILSFGGGNNAFKFDKIRIVNVEIDESFSYCESNKSVSEKPIEIELGLNNCQN